ncbi:MAG: peptidoglycan editing factor PgeF [Desulforegulaceae bacterium]|nr:peptidoglycan editing factor PgeF [Desulforegulaceae bacterium]
MVDYAKAPVFENIKNLYHGFFFRTGGKSVSPFDSLNVSFDVGDKESDVVRNRKFILNELGFDKMISVNQVHGISHYIPNPLEGAYGEHFLKKEDADILITDNPGQLLLIKTADCQPILIVDSKKRVCAAVHCGWKGLVSNIIVKTLDIMMEKYGSLPKDLSVAIGPSLGPCCAEFVNYKKEIPESLWEFRIGDYNFDLREISKQYFLKLGVEDRNIWIDQNCTKCREDFYFSYRNNKVTGRQASVIGWKL